MKKVLLACTLFLAAFAVQAQIVVSGNIDINGTTTWTNENIYILQGFVKVTANDTLVIEPGTIVKGDFVSKGSLIIERDGYLHAEGTPEQPIVFTSQRPVGQRQYGDWGGIILCGRASVNQPANTTNGTEAGEALVEGGVGSIYGGGSNPDDADNSGILRYLRIEFGGIPFQPNSEINGLTMCAVGNGTTIDHIQISYCGDDAYEWFGGTVNVKNIIAYRNWDDDFDTDFGYRGNIQFALAIRDPQIADQSGSNGFESDNDAQGTTNPPITQGRFSNVTIVGPYAFNSTINSNYKRALHLRRNTQTSALNSVFIGYPTGLLIESSSTQGNATNELLRFRHSVICQMGDSLATTTSANPNNINGSFNITNWFNTSGWNNSLVNTVAELQFNGVDLNNPDFTIAAGSPLATGANFTDALLQDGFFTPVNFRGALGTEDWTSCWTEWDPQNEPYTSAINNNFTASVSAEDNVTAFCDGGSVVLLADASDANVTFEWSTGADGDLLEVNSSGTFSVTARNDEGCTATSSGITITEYAPVAVAITADGSTSFCTGNSVVLTSSQASGNSWSTGETSASITVTESGSYSVTYTDANDCSAVSNTIEVNVSDSPIPTVAIDGSTTICEGSSVTLTSSAADSYDWFLNGNSLGVNAQSIEATEEGLYTVVVTNEDPCDGVGSSNAVLVSVNPTPTADADFTQTFGSLTVQFLNNSTNASSYEWNFGDGNSSTDNNPSHTYSAGGNYTVTLTAINGACEDVFSFDLLGVNVEEELLTSGLQLYPNPTEGEVTLVLGGNDKGTVDVLIYDLRGQLVLRQGWNTATSGQQLILDLSGLTNGLYMVQTSVNGGAPVVNRLSVVK